MSSETRVELEIVNELDAEKVNAITVAAGFEATLNRALFYVGAWRMAQLKPWDSPHGLKVDTEMIGDWYDYRKYLSNKTGFSISNIDDAVDRIDFLVLKGTALLSILDAIVKTPMAIDDLMNGPQTTMPVAELVDELIQLPNGAEARKRVMQEQGVGWYAPTDVETLKDSGEVIVDVSERDGDAETDWFQLRISGNGEPLSEARIEWVKSKFKIRRERKK